ncbi:MAG: hypothetical protein IJ389_00135 [Clostridia bacterium]|nr:hypothetical protein [Clostridia bacterium]
MYCGKCGLKLADIDYYCPNCGFDTGRRPEKKPQKNNNRLTILIVLAAIAVFLIIAVAVLPNLLLYLRTPEMVADKYITAIMEGDGDDVASLIHDDVWEAIIDELEDYYYIDHSDEDEAIDYIDDELYDFRDYIDDMYNYSYYKKWDWNYTATYSDIYDTSDVRELNKEIKERDIYGVKVTDARRMEATITVHSVNGYESHNIVKYFTVVKINGIWYLYEN